jgi:hypothetical protein
VPPWVTATVIGFFGVLAAWRLACDLRRGVSSSEVREYRVGENPTGYWVSIGGLMFIVFLGAAEVLHAFGLMGEPIATINAMLPLFAMVSSPVIGCRMTSFRWCR